MAPSAHDPLSDVSNTNMILVMGVTGSGKSHFINTLVAGTRDCQIIRTTVGGDTSLTLVDTPGLDDSRRSDAEVLEEITRCLTTQYQLGIPLRGVIYLHRITDPKMQGSALRNFELFQKICGESALGNVILLTTMWDKLKDRVEGLDRDQQLRTDFWNLMAAKGSYITSFDGSKEMAEGLVITLLTKEEVVLDIQKELKDEKLPLLATSAGRLLATTAGDNLDRANARVRVLEDTLAKAQREQDAALLRAAEHERRALLAERKRYQRDQERLQAKVAEDTKKKIESETKGSKWSSRVQIFAVVTNLAVSFVFNLLPIIGVPISGMPACMIFLPALRTYTAEHGLKDLCSDWPCHKRDEIVPHGYLCPLGQRWLRKRIRTEVRPLMMTGHFSTDKGSWVLDIDTVYQKAAPVRTGTDDKSRQQGESGKIRKKSMPAADPRLDSRPTQLQHDEYTHSPQAKQNRDHELPPIPAGHDSLVLEQTLEELQSLRRQHESLIRERDVVRLDLNRAAQQLNQNQAQKTLTSVGDDYIRRSWGSLRYGVKDWAIRWFSNDYMHKSPTFPNAGPPKWCAELMEDPRSYLKVPELRPVLVQAYLWCMLCDRIFNVKCNDQTTVGLYWAGRHRTALAQLRAALRPGEYMLAS
nr:hypothetical protein CFP56_09550 [Quercus suber]